MTQPRSVSGPKRLETGTGKRPTGLPQPKSPTKSSGDYVVMGMGMGMSLGAKRVPSTAKMESRDEGAKTTGAVKPVAEVVAGRRQSFRPRPSLDAWVGGAGGRLPGMLWNANAVGVKEEEEF